MSNWTPADWWVFVVGICAGVPIALGLGSLVRNLVGYARYRKQAEQFNRQVEEDRREREKMQQVLEDLEKEAGEEIEP